MDAEREQLRFALLSAVAMPVWLAMIVAPRSALTAKLVGRADVLLAGLSLAYVAQLAEGLAAGTGNRRDLTRARELRAALAAAPVAHRLMLAGRRGTQHKPPDAALPESRRLLSSRGRCLPRRSCSPRGDLLHGRPGPPTDSAARQPATKQENR